MKTDDLSDREEPKDESRSKTYSIVAELHRRWY